MSDVKVFKLTNGEEIMATKHDEDDEYIYIINPIVPVGNIGDGRIGFAPWSFMSEKNCIFPVNKNHVLYHVDPNDDILRGYQQQFSEIITPKKKPILLKS